MDECKKIKMEGFRSQYIVKCQSRGKTYENKQNVDITF